MSKQRYGWTRTWVISGVVDHTITVDWDRRRWTLPDSIVRVDGEIVSRANFWRRHFYYGVHAFRLGDPPEHQILLKYDEEAGYRLYVDGQERFAVEASRSATQEAALGWGRLDWSASVDKHNAVAVAAG